MSLKKEMVSAIILGLLLGVATALIAAKIPQKILGQKMEANPMPTAEAEPTINPVSENDKIGLEILLPQDQELVMNPEINISGRAKGKQTILVITSSFEDVVVASDDGTFTSKVKLEEGANEIKVFALSDDVVEEKSIIVNYSKEEI